ncbi:hypothetical protein ACMFMG_005403 [Clarireedia jacksonii]
MTPPARAMTSRQRFLLGTIFGSGSLFIAMKWKAVMQRSEAAKVAGARENYFVVPGRSGELCSLPIDDYDLEMYCSVLMTMVT